MANAAVTLYPPSFIVAGKELSPTLMHPPILPANVTREEWEGCVIMSAESATMTKSLFNNYAERVVLQRIKETNPDRTSADVGM